MGQKVRLYTVIDIETAYEIDADKPAAVRPLLTPPAEAAGTARRATGVAAVCTRPGPRSSGQGVGVVGSGLTRMRPGSTTEKWPSQSVRDCSAVITKVARAADEVA